MLLESGAGEWRGTYLVDSVFLAAIVESSADLATAMLISSVEIHVYDINDMAWKTAPTLTLPTIVTDIQLPISPAVVLEAR